MKYPTIGLALASLAALATSVQATHTIYSDGFNRTGNLNGSSPDTTSGLYGGTAGAQWTAGSSTLTGTEAPFNGLTLAYLPFTPQTGQVYTLTVVAQDGNDWGGIGFTTTATPSTTANLNSVEGGAGSPAWILYQNNTASLRYGGTTAATSSTHSGYNTVTLVLDTTGASWKETGFFNGTEYGSHTYASTPVIQTVALSAAYSGGGMNADSFSLTTNLSAIPEPGSLLALGCLVGSGLVLRTRRRPC